MPYPDQTLERNWSRVLPTTCFSITKLIHKKRLFYDSTVCFCCQNQLSFSKMTFSIPNISYGSQTVSSLYPNELPVPPMSIFKRKSLFLKACVRTTKLLFPEHLLFSRKWSVPKCLFVPFKTSVYFVTRTVIPKTSISCF